MAKKQKSLLTLQLLKKKLSEWTLSAHVVETLGLSSEDEAQIKKELIDLCDKGQVEKEGVRRGLKFRFKPGTEVEEVEEEEVSQESKIFEAGDMLAYLKQKRHDRDNLAIAGKEFSDLLQYVLLTCSPGSDPSVLSYSLVVKNTTDGVSLRVYSGIVLELERTFTKDKFLKYIAQAGVQFNEEPKSRKRTEPKEELAAVV